MRLFVALDLPEALAAEVGRRCSEARRHLPRARWVRPEALHLTLAFLGERDEELLPTLREALVPAFATVEPFSLRLEDGGTFPPHRPARVAWLGVKADADLAELGGRVRGALREAVGFEPDRRGFSAHLTVARPKAPWRRREVEYFRSHFRGPVGEAFRVEEGVLYQSLLSPSGARYRARERFPLGVDDRPGERP